MTSDLKVDKDANAKREKPISAEKENVARKRRSILMENTTPKEKGFPGLLIPANVTQDMCWSKEKEVIVELGLMSDEEMDEFESCEREKDNGTKHPRKIDLPPYEEF